MNLDSFRKHLPQYLFPGDEDELYEALELFSGAFKGFDTKPEKKAALLNFKRNFANNFYTRKLLQDPLLYQGDVVSSVPYTVFPKDYKDKNQKTASIVELPAIVLSNTCDLDLNNTRDRQHNIVLAPIYNLSKVKQSFLKKMTEPKVDSFCNSVRNWELTNVFYLPHCEWLQIEESIVFLDQTFSVPPSAIDRKTLPDTRISSLSMFGFYLFLFKISIHFTRFKEKVHRPFINVHAHQASLYDPYSVD